MEGMWAVLTDLENDVSWPREENEPNKAPSLGDSSGKGVGTRREEGIKREEGVGRGS